MFFFQNEPHSRCFQSVVVGDVDILSEIEVFHAQEVKLEQPFKNVSERIKRNTQKSEAVQFYLSLGILKVGWRHRFHTTAARNISNISF